jgi:hypothetical protein
MLAPWLMSIAVVFAIYRRARRNIGRQAVQVGRLRFRIGAFAVIGALVLIAALRDVALLGPLVAGIAVGAGLGIFGLKQTRFEATAEGRFYTPHTYIGLLISALFLARIAFRFFTVYLPAQGALQSNPNPFAGYQGSPLTLAILGVLMGYYIIFNAGVLRKSRDPATPLVG